MSIPTQVQNWLDELRTKADEATSQFGADDSEITKHRSGRVTVTLFFVTEDSTPNDNAPPNPSDIRASEDAAVAAAEDLRSFGAETQVHSEGAQTRVIGVFSAPSQSN